MKDRSKSTDVRVVFSILIGLMVLMWCAGCQPTGEARSTPTRTQRTYADVKPRPLSELLPPYEKPQGHQKTRVVLTGSPSTWGSER